MSVNQSSWFKKKKIEMRNWSSGQNTFKLKSK